MNCRKENYHAFIARKMSGWKELAVCGIDKLEQLRGRRNLRRLAGTHPDVAVECGLDPRVDGVSGGMGSEIPGLDG